LALFCPEKRHGAKPCIPIREAGEMEYEQFQKFIQCVEKVLQDPQIAYQTEVSFPCPICGGRAVAVKFQENHGTGFCRECGIVCSE